MIKKAKEQKLGKHRRKKNKPAVKAKRGKREVTELERMAVRRALMAEVIPAEWLAPEIAETAEPEAEEPGVQPAPKKAEDEKAVKRKRKKQKSAAGEKKPGKRKAAKRKETAPEADLTAEAAAGAESTAEGARPAAPKPAKPGRKAADKKAKKDKAAKRKGAKQKSAAKEKAGKPGVTESEMIAVKEALAVDMVPAAGVTAEEAEESESRPKKSGRKAADKKAKEEKTAKRKRAKQKSAAKEKAGKRKAAGPEKIAPEEDLAAGVVPDSGPAEKAPGSAESKPKRRGRKAEGKKAKEEQAAKRKARSKEKAGKGKDGRREQITVKKALLVEPVPVPEEAGPQKGAIRSATSAAPGAEASARFQKPSQPVPPPVAGRATGSPSRFWPGVALGTVAVIVGFGYIRHLAKDQTFSAPRPFVTAESERAATSAKPSVADTVIATTKPPAPGVPPVTDRTGGRSPEAAKQDKAVQPGETGSASSKPVPLESLPALPGHRAGPVTDSKTVAVEPEGASQQSSRRAVSAPAGVAQERAAKTRPRRKAVPSARYQALRPGVPAEVARWQMPWAYQPYRPRFQPVRPGYPMYICPVEPRALWYPGTKTRDRK